MSALYRALPGVDTLVDHPTLASLPHDLVVASARLELDALRAGIKDGSISEIPDVPARVAARVDALMRGRMRTVINATGIVVHTNLGRAPWAAEAREAAVAAMGYCNLEMELETGARGGRLDGVRNLLRHLVGAEDAVVVNNCAAAVLLTLTALAKDREVIVSRGELVEIGGSFRVPEVIASGGAHLREVGATNRTRVADFEAAITDETAAVLRVHTSNFRMVGFTEQPDRRALADLARSRGVWMLEDLGSGSLDGESSVPGFDEVSAREALADGADAVMFSGDKLLGGPQAGVVAGRSDVIRRLRKHPMYRALRIDKVSLAALERTLALHARGERVPALAMIEASEAELETRARALGGLLEARSVAHEVCPDVSYVGGGALPGQGLPGWTVTVAGESRHAHALRTGQPSVVARLSDGRLRFDVRTVEPERLEALADRVASVMRGLDGSDRRDMSP